MSFLLPPPIISSCRPPPQTSIIMILTQRTIVGQVAYKQSIPLQAIKNRKWAVLLDVILRVLQMVLHTISHRLHTAQRPLVSSDVVLPTLSSWTKWWSRRLCIGNSCPVLKRMPMMCAQWKDYIDLYMWCCGCIPPVRLSPICYRFGLKKRRCSKHKRVGEGLFSTEVHSTSSISRGIMATSLWRMCFSMIKNLDS